MPYEGSEKFQLFSSPLANDVIDFMISEYLKRELESVDYEGKYPKEEKALKDVEHYAYNNFRKVFKLPLLSEEVHFSEINLFEAVKKIDSKPKLEDLAFYSLFGVFFRKCIEIFSNVEITDEMLFKGLFTDGMMFDHFMDNFGQKGIDREEHREKFLSDNQEFLDFFGERFDEARRFALREITAPPIIERALNLSSLSVGDLMGFKLEFLEVLQKTNKCCFDPKECSLCQEVDVMPFLMDLGQFRDFVRDGFKNVFIPRYFLFAMAIFKAFKSNLLPYDTSIVFDGFEDEMEDLFHHRVRIEFLREETHEAHFGYELDFYLTMMDLQFTTLFHKDGVGANVGGWVGDYDYNEESNRFYYYFKHCYSLHPFKENSYFSSKHRHKLCDGRDHDIDDKDIARIALSTMIMFAIIGIKSLKDHLAKHS